MSWYRTATLGFALVACNAAWGVDDATLRARAEFVEALSLAERGASPADADSDTLRAYPLYPYLAAARLMRRPPSEDVDAEIRRFIDLHAGEPVTYAVHRAWLASLVDRAAWRALVDNYAQNVASTDVECEYLRARVELGETDGLAELIAARWPTPARLPPSCEPAFQWLRDIGELDADKTEARVRLLLDAGEYQFARIIAGRLPEPRARRYTRSANMLRDPIGAIDEIIDDSYETLDEELLLAVWTLAARDHPHAAEERFDAFQRALALDASMRSKLTLALALGLAWDRQPDALRRFARVAERDLDDYALGWLARAALWEGNWSAVESAIALMSPEERNAPIWRYWQARSLEGLDAGERAGELYRGLLAVDNFYSAMAAARLGERIEPSVVPLERKPTVIRSVESWPAIVRARELFALGRRVDATREWRFAVQWLSAEEREQAIFLASDWGWHDVAVAMATEASVFNHYEVLYPLPFETEIANAARTTRIATEILYGLIRQESLFREDAASPSGALGLTQLLPATARRVARDSQNERLATSDLLEPAVSIRLGAATLRSLRDRFSGQLVVALAAYNAGPNAADRWLPPQPVPTDVWIENIPFNETRDYVKRIIWHSIVFAWRRSSRPQDPSPWLETVSGFVE